MLERVHEGPAQTLALRASGAVAAQDVEAAINAAMGIRGRDRPRRDYRPGFWRRILPSWRAGLQAQRLRHKSLVKLAVVVDPEQMDGATLNGFEASPVRIRQFARADENAALEWAAAARRGE